MARTRISESDKGRILDLLALGWAAVDIAREVGVTTRQVAAVKAHRTIRKNKALVATDVDSAKHAEAPPHNSQVNLRTLGTMSVFQSTLSRIAVPIGCEATTGEQVYWDPDPEYGSANPHLMIIGESGFGKTYTIQCLVAELVCLGVSSVIIDYGRGFELDSAPSEFLRAAEPVEVMAGQQGINLNPLQIFSSDINGPINVAVRVADSFSRVYRIGVQQHALLRDTIIEVFKDSGIFKSDRSSWQRPAPSLSKVNDKLEELAADRSHESSKVALSLKSHISTFFVFDTFRSEGQGLKWEYITGGNGKTLILQLEGLDGRTQQVVTEFLLWDLFHFVASGGPRPLSLFCVLDEAHNLSFDSGTPADKLIREARKFGLGLIFASQQPEDFSDTAYANTASKIIFQTLDEAKRVSKKVTNKCRNCGTPSELAELIGKLPRGKVFFLTQNLGFVVEITPFTKRFTL